MTFTGTSRRQILICALLFSQSVDPLGPGVVAVAEFGPWVTIDGAPKRLIFLENRRAMHFLQLKKLRS